MSCNADVEQRLRETGQRVTAQRVQVASILHEARGHLNADQVHDSLHREHPGSHASLATVYRTLQTLVQLNLVTEISPVRGKAEFEWIRLEERHHHLECVSCGRVVPLAHDVVSRIRTDIRDETGFEPYLDGVAIRGRCNDCAGAK